MKTAVGGGLPRCKLRAAQKLHSPVTMASAKLYVDMMSQPCRTVVIFCRLNRLPVEEVPVIVSKGQTRTTEYKQINPLGKIPALEEAGGAFKLSESPSILRYLCETHGVPDHWYPACPKERARVNSIMDWHLGNLRIGSMLTVWNRAIAYNLGVKGNEQLVQIYGLPTLQGALKTIETVWLADTSGGFLGGQRQISIADLLLACEVEMLCLLDGAPEGKNMQELLAPYPRLRGWLQRVAQACEPHYSETHALLLKARARMVQRRQQQADSKL